MSNLNELKPINTLNPFGKFCCTIGNLPSSYMLSLSYEEQVLWFCDFLENTVIPAINNNAEAILEVQNLLIELKDYVNNYFSDLNVQNEINNKLDEMAEDGSLANIINEQVFSNLNFIAENPLIGNYKTITNDDKYNCWPVTLVKNDTIYCYYNKRVSHQSEQNTAMKGNSICLKSSTNGGLTWSEEKQIFYNENYDYTTFGGVCVNDNTILLWVTEIDVDNNIYNYYQYSSQDGINFTKTFIFKDSSDPLVAEEGYLNMGIVTKTGRIITSKQTYNSSDNTRKTIVLYSDTGGVGWTGVLIYSKPINDGNYNNMPWECRFVETMDGLIGYGRNNTGFAFQFTSTDNGNTWTTPVTTNLQYTRNVPIAPFVINPKSSIHSQKLIIITCDRYGNGFYKYELLPHVIFNNPTSYPEPELLDFSCSAQCYRDWGYGNIIQYNNTRENDLAFVFYTTREPETSLGGVKQCQIAIFYFNTSNYEYKPNLIRNGNFKDYYTEDEINVSANSKSWISDNIAIKPTSNITSTPTNNPNGNYSNPIYLRNVTSSFKLYTWIYNSIGVKVININFYSYSSGYLKMYFNSELIGTFNIAGNSRNSFCSSVFINDNTAQITFEFDVTGNVSIYQLGCVSGYKEIGYYTSFYNDKELFYEELGNTRLTANWQSTANIGSYTNLYFSRKFYNPSITFISNNNVENKITPRANADDFLDDVDILVTGITHTKANLSCYSPLSGNPSIFIASNVIIDCRPNLSNL